MNYVNHIDDARAAMEKAANAHETARDIERAVWAVARKYLDHDTLPGWVCESITHERDVICHREVRRILVGRDRTVHYVRMS